MTLSRERAQELRAGLTHQGAGQADAESPEVLRRSFFPVPEHARAFDPEVALIVGDRGAGKSKLFRAVVENGLLPSIARYAKNVSPPTNSRFVKAWPIERGPDDIGLRRSMSSENASTLWFAYLIRVLHERFDEASRRTLEGVTRVPGADVTAVLRAFNDVNERATVALDELDDRLQQADAWLFVGYDELDTLGGADWNTLKQGCRGLVTFWAAHARRWRRLRPKLFLRSDLFRRSTEVLGADITKLAANRAELAWSEKNLYGMLTKHIANASNELLQYAKAAKVAFDRDEDLYWIPRLSSAEDARPLIERLAGPFMGSDKAKHGKKKGFTFRWILEHVRDGRGKATPRALVRLIERAAQREQDNPHPGVGQRLLHPTALRGALDDVSRDHVRQAASHEWPWLHGVKQRVSGMIVPCSRRDLERNLQSDWDQTWAETSPVRPPADDVGELVDYLLEVGVLRRRGDRLDAPDLYAAGLGLKTQGGVRRE